jgi:hypothetical protein
MLTSQNTLQAIFSAWLRGQVPGNWLNLGVQKRYFSSLLGWMATKAEKFVGNIKSVWKTAKPFVSMVRKGLDMAAEYILLTPFPWIGGALKLISLGLGALTAFEKSPIAKAVDKAIQWSIKLAKKWHAPSTGMKEKERPTENAIAEDEMDTARQHQETFRAAAQEPTLSDEQRRLLEVASVINDFELAKADVERAMTATPVDFEHYLRIRATNKLLKLSEAKFKSAKDICDLTSDDLFLVEIASDLVKSTPELSENSSDRLNNILEEQGGFKSEVQHLQACKVRRCKTQPDSTSNFSLKNA